MMFYVTALFVTGFLFLGLGQGFLQENEQLLQKENLENYICGLQFNIQEFVERFENGKISPTLLANVMKNLTLLLESISSNSENSNLCKNEVNPKLQHVQNELQDFKKNFIEAQISQDALVIALENSNSCKNELNPKLQHVQNELQDFKKKFIEAQISQDKLVNSLEYCTSMKNEFASTLKDIMNNLSNIKNILNETQEIKNELLNFKKQFNETKYSLNVVQDDLNGNVVKGTCASYSLSSTALNNNQLIENIILYKPTTAAPSNSSGYFFSHYGNDGDLNSFYHSKRMANPWWIVSMENSYKIVKITFHSRRFSKDRSLGVQFYVADDIPFNGNEIPNVTSLTLFSERTKLPPYGSDESIHEVPDGQCGNKVLVIRPFENTILEVGDLQVSGYLIE